MVTQTGEAGRDYRGIQGNLRDDGDHHYPDRGDGFSGADMSKPTKLHTSNMYSSFH